MKQIKLDLTKKYPGYYSAKNVPEIIEFEEGKFLSIKGKGSPGSDEFKAQVGALYPLAYGVKMLMRKEGKDFTIAKLEGLWWVDSSEPWFEVPREDWRWKLLIRQPEFVTSEIVAKAKKEVIEKKKIELVEKINFEKMKEGKCVQMLHCGSYSTEPESLAKMAKSMAEENLEKNGLHHEIYLVMAYPKKVLVEKLRTILRQPVRDKSKKKIIT